MYKYFFGYFTAIFSLLPRSCRADHLVATIRSLCMPVDKILTGLNDLYRASKYSCATSCQIIYLEKILNDRFNATATYPAITITDNLAADEPAYMGNASEEQAAMYLGNTYASDAIYATGEEAIHNDMVWKSLSDDNENHEPEADSEYWQSPTTPQEAVQYIGHVNEYNGGLYFIVNISADNHAAIEEAAMSAILNRYKIYGVTYTYNIYEEI